MSAAQYLELVQTEDGDVLLRRSDADAGEDAAPLVTLRFSPEVRALLGDHLNEVALAMFGAGMRATSALVQHPLPADDGVPRLLH